MLAHDLPGEGEADAGVFLFGGETPEGFSIFFGGEEQKNEVF